MASDTNFLNFAPILDIDNFVNNSLLNDTKYSNGVMRLNRFVAVMDIKNLKKSFPDLFHNEEISNYGNPNEWMAWNVFKINCPAFRLGMETREVDAIQRHFVTNWEHDDLEISYLESSDMKIRHYFFEWMESSLSSNTYKRSYYDDVKADWFVIYPLNFQGQAERYEIFYDVLPIDINSINYDVSDEGSQIVLTTVKFKYIRHRLLSLDTISGDTKKKQRPQFNLPPEDKPIK